VFFRVVSGSDASAAVGVEEMGRGGDGVVEGVAPAGADIDIRA
jgi:hypothetical protein